MRHWRNRQITIDRTCAIGMIALGLSITGAAAAQSPPGPDEMWRLIQEQQRKMEDLERRLEATGKTVEQNEMAVEAVAEAAQEQTGGDGWWQRTSLGGYGELHYNGGDDDELDFHRFVLFFGHEFSDRLRLFSEFELEHALAGDGKPGEVELEQAYLEYDLTESVSGRSGLFLIPAGILNETHEPPTFYGVERNRVENKIIPSTWWEGGTGLSFTLRNGVRIDGAVHGGLEVPTEGGSAFLPRSGRQKVADSRLTDPAFTGRLRYTGVPGIEVASTLQYQTDTTQGKAGVDSASALLWEVHADVARAITRDISFGFRALYAQWNFDGDEAETLGRDEQYGWYVEPSVKFDLAGDQALGLFARYSADDNTAGGGGDSKYELFTIGTNYWLHPMAVLKLDYDFERPPGDAEKDERINLGVGFQF